MGQLWKSQIGVTEETWLNLLQHASQEEIDTFLAILEQNGMKIIEVEKYNRLMALVESSIEEIEALEHRVKTLLSL